MALGLLPGTEVVVTRVGPLGDPITIASNGQSFSVRRHQAQSMDVAPHSA
jgi:ferrous iron transport protein A